MNAPLKLKLLRDQPHIGDNGHGKYYLYSVQDESGVEFAWFAPPDAHEVLQNLKAGAEIIAKRISRAKIEVSILGNGADEKPTNGTADHFKDIMQQSLQDAIDITRSMKDVPFQAEDLRSICSCLFIARTRANGHSS